jgi:hypothetical protein
VLSKTINVDTNESGKLLEFRTSHGEIKKICIKNKDLFAGLSQTILKDLAGAGLHVNLEAPTKKILVYLNFHQNHKKKRLARQWISDGKWNYHAGRARGRHSPGRRLWIDARRHKWLHRRLEGKCGKTMQRQFETRSRRFYGLCSPSAARARSS